MYKEKPNEVKENWRKYFEALEKDSEITNMDNGVKAEFMKRTIAVETLCRGFQDKGHEAANLDPLQLEKK